MTVEQAADMIALLQSLNNAMYVILSVVFFVLVLFTVNVLYWLFGKFFFGGI